MHYLLRVLEDELSEKQSDGKLSTAEFLPKMVAVHPSLHRKLQSTWVWIRVGTTEDCVACKADPTISNVDSCRLYGASAV